MVQVGITALDHPIVVDWVVWCRHLNLLVML